MRGATTICLGLLLLILTAVGSAASAEDGRDVALLRFDPMSARVSGAQGTTLHVIYDGTSAGTGLRGYHLELSYDAALVYVDSLDAHVQEGTFLSDVGGTAFYTTLLGDDTLVLDCAILGNTEGATGVGQLCSIYFKGQPVVEGFSLVEFTEVTLRDPDNHGITYSAGFGVLTLDNTPPNTPTLDPEPEFTQGTTNYVSWSDESVSGAVGYCCEVSETPDFEFLAGTTGCTILTHHTFTDLSDGQIYYYRVKCRDDVWNTSDWSDSEHSTQDDTPPETEVGPLAEYCNTVSFNVPFSSFDATSGLHHVELYYRVDGGAYTQFGATFSSSPIAFTGPGEGHYDFYTVGTDNVGNVEDAPLDPDCSTEVDLTPPPSPVDLVAMPGHNCISLSWTVPESRDAPIEGTLLVRRPWGLFAYPEYDDWGAPYGYPAHPADGFVVAFVPGTGPQTFNDTGFTDLSRNVHYYTAFSRDAAGNYSLVTQSAQDRATSYWLADVREETGAPQTYDGLVDYYDKVAYSLSYYTSEGDPFYDAELDVGPTDDWSRLGIPLTDNVINFEDLMILAMNYGRVYPGCFHDDETGIPEGRGGGATISLELVSGDLTPGSEAVFSMALVAEDVAPRGAATLLSFNSTSMDLLAVEPAGRFEDDEDSFFFGSSPEDGRIRVDAASLGNTACLCGQLATLRFRVLSDDVAGITFHETEVRDAANCPIAHEAVGWQPDTAVAGVPVAWRLRQNMPNPFNPRTEIVFDVPERRPVALRVYSASGRLIATLLDDVCDAGVHRVTWDGADAEGREVPSGVYFYVLAAGERRLTRKMALTR
ncbi:MAG: hypothetical protein JXB46_09765 [Candidatus Eisenbacteria bacterium]|nr:hypothetical protein [Candidatus Eisenbacteria bacterium]